MSDESDYLKYRGKCKEFSQKLAIENPDLILVRGYYYCPISNKDEQHWWCKNKLTGEIIDPTSKQFLSKGFGDYREFDGNINCCECNKKIKEDEAQNAGKYPVCSYECYGKLVGVKLNDQPN